jgi:hypothetical protein
MDEVKFFSNFPDPLIIPKQDNFTPGNQMKPAHNRVSLDNTDMAGEWFWDSKYSEHNWYFLSGYFVMYYVNSIFVCG